MHVYVHQQRKENNEIIWNHLAQYNNISAFSSKKFHKFQCEHFHPPHLPLPMQKRSKPLNPLRDAATAAQQ